MTIRLIESLLRARSDTIFSYSGRHSIIKETRA